jgi:lipopolysaccharide export system permease protein
LLIQTMLFHSSLRRELARSFGATLLVLITIVVTMLLIRTLGLANKGSVNPEEILLVLTYTVLGRMPTVLTLALFIAVVSTLSRLYRDSEMVIWLGSGLGLTSFLRPIFRFAWPILLVITLLVLFVWPWGNEQTEALRDRFQKRSDLERIAPGQFMESSNGQRVFFIDKTEADGSEGRNVFIATQEAGGRETLTSARSGRLDWVNGVQVLTLENGQRLEYSPQDDGMVLKVSEFSRYTIEVAQSRSAVGVAGGLKARSTQDLIADPNRANLAELGWRIGLVLTAINFVLLAVAVSAGNPRAGKSGNLLFMLFAFVFYYNFLTLGQSWVASGKVALLPFMLTLHGGVLGLSLLWLGKRHYNWTWWPRWPVRSPRVAA